MLQNISPRDTLKYLLLVLLGIGAFMLFEFFVFRYFFPIISLIAIGLVVVVMSFLIYRKLIINFDANRKEARGGFQQIEPLFFLYKKIDFRKPLLGVRDFAASPDFLALLAEIVLEQKPKTIVEAGSGISTVVNGYLLEQLGAGKVFSLEHDENFAKMTNENIQNHRVSNFAEVIFAPLKKYNLNGKDWRWYDVDILLEKIKKIDLLIIDGPPVSLQSHARYPALPILMECLSDDAIILIDDCIRIEDRQTVEMWIHAFPNFSKKYYWLEKGAIILKKENF